MSEIHVAPCPGPSEPERNPLGHCRKGGKCRLLHGPDLSLKKQKEAVCNQAAEFCEQVENKPGVCKTKKAPIKKESPDALAGAVEAQIPQKDTHLSPQESHKAWEKAMSFHDMPSPQKMARVFGYALTLGDSPAWHDFSRFAEIYLSEEERAKLAHAALKALGGNDLLHVIADAFSRAGPPREAWYNPLPEAREWADWATSNRYVRLATSSCHCLVLKSQPRLMSNLI